MADAYARHGWSVDWFTEHEGERTVVVHTVENRVAFPNEQRALSRYAQYWDFVRFGMPTSLPRVDARLSARLHVPAPGYELVVRSPDRIHLVVDGYEAEGRTIAPGWHRVDVDWSSNPRPNMRFALQWRSDHGGLVEVPRDALVPLEGSWPPIRFAVWIGFLVGFALFGSLAARAALEEEPMAQRKKIALFATVAVVGLGLALRLVQYDVTPEFQENDDERFAIWNGYSLLENGTTRGLTLWWGEYMGHGDTIERVQYFDRQYHVVTPYFEHPPLMHVLVGAAGHLAGAESFVTVRLRHARLVPIGLAVVTMLLMLAIGRRVDRTGPGPWLGVLLWAAIPWIAIQTRVIKEEALLVPLELGSVLFFLRWRDDGRRTGDLMGAAICAGACALAKVTGIALVLALAVLVTSVGPFRDAVIATVVGVMTASLYIVFGAIIDWDLFWFSQSLQQSRPVHFNIFLRFFDSPLINHNLVGRGWLLFLWLAGLPGLLGRGTRDAAALGVPLVTYFAAIALGSGTWTFGWYVLPLLPFLCLGAGRFLAETWQKPGLLRGSLIVMVLVFYGLNFVLPTEQAKDASEWPHVRRLVTIVLAAGIVPFALAEGFKDHWGRAVGRFGLVACLATMVTVGSIFVWRYDEIRVDYNEFDRDRYFDR